jgi:hypothetical protein
MERRIIKANRPPEPDPNSIKKGHLLGVKAPPYYKIEYLYEVTGCGDKMVRADLCGSKKVKKSWTREELSLLIEMGVVRIARDDERPVSHSSSTEQPEPEI